MTVAGIGYSASLHCSIVLVIRKHVVIETKAVEVC